MCVLTELTHTSFAIDLGFKITNVTMESRRDRLTFTSETYNKIQDSINSLVRYFYTEDTSMVMFRS